MKRFYATYVYAYGLAAKTEVFDDTESLLAFIKKAKAEEADGCSPYTGLRVMDKHFPVDGGWGWRKIDRVDEQLLQLYPPADDDRAVSE